MTNNSRRLEALRYAYDMCGSSPCEDCNHYRHITPDEELQNFIEDIDDCITKLVSSRLNGDKQLEQKSLTQMESLMVQTKQLLTYFIENNETSN